MVKTIIQQNKLDNENFEINISFRSTVKKDGFSLTLEVNQHALKSFINREKIFIGWSSCRVLKDCGIVCCYRCSQFGHMPKYFKNNIACMQDIFLTFDDVILIGDINVDFLMRDHPNTRNFMNIINNVLIRQIVTEPTRVGNDYSYLLDVICVTRKLSENGCMTVDLLHISDHKLTYCSIDISAPLVSARPITFRDIKKSER